MLALMCHRDWIRFDNEASVSALRTGTTWRYSWAEESTGPEGEVGSAEFVILPVEPQRKSPSDRDDSGKQICGPRVGT